MSEKENKIEKTISVVNRIMDVARIGNLHLNAPELATLIFLKFTSDNAEKLGVEVDNFHSYNALISLLTSGAISIQDFIGSCSETIAQTGMDRYGVGAYLAQFAVPLAKNRAFLDVLHLIGEIDLVDDKKSCTAARLMATIISKLRVTARDELNTSSDSIAQLMASVAVSEDCASIYDGVCGFGLGLMHAHILAPQATVEGQDININCVMVSAIMQWLSFNPRFNIVSGDTLRNPLTVKHKQKYDAVIMAPPFGLRIDDDVIMNATKEMVRYGDLLQRKSDWFFVQHALASLSENGTGILHLPMGALFQGGKVQDIRKVFVDNGHIHSVLALPEGTVPGTSIPSALLVIGEKANDGKILFVNGSAPQVAHYFFRAKRGVTTISAEGIRELTSIILERKEVNGVSAITTVEEIAEKKYLLTPSVYTDTSDAEMVLAEPVDKICDAMLDLEQHLVLNGRELADAIQEFNAILSK